MRLFCNLLAVTDPTAIKGLFDVLRTPQSNALLHYDHPRVVALTEFIAYLHYAAYRYRYPHFAQHGVAVTRRFHYAPAVRTKPREAHSVAVTRRVFLAMCRSVRTPRKASEGTPPGVGSGPAAGLMRFYLKYPTDPHLHAVFTTLQEVIKAGTGGRFIHRHAWAQFVAAVRGEGQPPGVAGCALPSSPFELPDWGRLIRVDLGLSRRDGEAPWVLRSLWDAWWAPPVIRAHTYTDGVAEARGVEAPLRYAAWWHTPVFAHQGLLRRLAPVRPEGRRAGCIVRGGAEGWVRRQESRVTPLAETPVFQVPTNPHVHDHTDLHDVPNAAWGQCEGLWVRRGVLLEWLYSRYPGLLRLAEGIAWQAVVGERLGVPAPGVVYELMAPTLPVRVGGAFTINREVADWVRYSPHPEAYEHGNFAGGRYWASQDSPSNLVPWRWSAEARTALERVTVTRSASQRLEERLKNAEACHGWSVTAGPVEVLGPGGELSLPGPTGSPTATPDTGPANAETNPPAHETNPTADPFYTAEGETVFDIDKL